VQDWDTAPTAIDWPRLRTFLRTVKQTGSIPADHHSHDHLNMQKNIDVPDATRNYWRAEFARLNAVAATGTGGSGGEGTQVVWGFVDGFLMYWDPVCFLSSVCEC